MNQSIKHQPALKNSILSLIFLTSILSPGFSQSVQETKASRFPHFSVNVGIGYQWFSNLNRFGSLSIEIPIQQYQHLGFRINKVFDGNSPSFDYYNETISPGSFEIGFYGKYFLHGRFTGRKSGFFMGPDIRFGVRKYVVDFYDNTTGQVYPVKENHKTSKLMLGWGIQWHFGQHAILEIAAPIGFENIRFPARNVFGFGYDTRSHNTLVILPSLTFGIGF